MKTLRVQATTNDKKYIQLEDETPPESLQPYNVLVNITATALRQQSHEILEFLSAGNTGYTFPATTDFSGRIVKVGSDVTHISEGDIVCGVLSPLSKFSACSDICQVHELDIVKIPASRTETEAVACIGPAIRAYTALIYQAGLSAGSSVLIMSGASINGMIAIQLALHWSTKVLTAVCGDDERRFVEKNFPDVAQVIDIGSKNASLVSVVMEETGSLGVDIILDDGVETNSTEDTSEPSVSKTPHIHDIISCLAVNGKWVTSRPNLQLDPPNSLMLSMRNASVSFLFEHVWTMSRSHQGRYLHMFNDIMDKLASGIIKAHIARTVQFVDAEDVLTNLPERQIGVTVMHMN